jgi:hypothetical protein
MKEHIERGSRGKDGIKVSGLLLKQERKRVVEKESGLTMGSTGGREANLLWLL